MTARLTCLGLPSPYRIPYLPYFDMLGKGAPDESLDRKSKSSPEYLRCVLLPGTSSRAHH